MLGFNRCVRPTLHYEYSDYVSEAGEVIAFDSYLVAEQDLVLGQLRMLDVDNRLVLPLYTHVRLLITAADVLHSFAVPSLGVKCDAVPGRLNQTSLFVLREGVFYGGCSELCVSRLSLFWPSVSSFVSYIALEKRTFLLAGYVCVLVGSCTRKC